MYDGQWLINIFYDLLFCFRKKAHNPEQDNINCNLVADI